MRRRFRRGSSAPGQLGQANVYSVHGGVGACDIAKGGAAGHIGPVDIVLDRDAGLLTDGPENAGGDRVGGIFLVGAVLDDNARVHVRAVGVVRFFREIGVDSVGVVGGDHKAAGHGAEGILPGASGGFYDAGQGVLQEGGASALLGAAAHLLVVKDAVHRHVSRVDRGQKAFQRCKGALEVIQPRGGDKIMVRAPDAARVPVIKEQLRAGDVRSGHTGSLCHKLHKPPPGSAVAHKGQHILLDVIFDDCCQTCGPCEWRGLE